MRLLISDANILIDMEAGALMETLFQLPMQFGIPDLLYYEEIEPGSPGLEGLGLRPAGHRVLTLADLKAIGGPLDHRAPTRVIELHLTGNMERYRWSMDGVEFSQSTPVHFPAGERIRVILHNDTMMTHPMHLHGMWAELESPEGAFQARLHTIPVQPAQRIQFQVTADALGRWAWHCHLMYHMDMGMFREVIVA